jgi:hypothetical protein
VVAGKDAGAGEAAGGGDSLAPALGVGAIPWLLAAECIKNLKISRGTPIPLLISDALALSRVSRAFDPAESRNSRVPIALGATIIATISPAMTLGADFSAFRRVVLSMRQKITRGLAIPLLFGTVRILCVQRLRSLRFMAPRSEPAHSAPRSRVLRAPDTLLQRDRPDLAGLLRHLRRSDADTFCSSCHL